MRKESVTIRAYQLISCYLQVNLPQSFVFLQSTVSLQQSQCPTFSFQRTFGMIQSQSHVRIFVTPELQPTRLLSPWNFPGKNIGMGCHLHLQGIFSTQRLNLGLLHCRQIIYQLGHLGRKPLVQPKAISKSCAFFPTFSHNFNN